MATIIDMITNDHSRDGGHPWGRLEDLEHFGEGDHPNNSDHHRGGDLPRDSGCLRNFTILRDGYLFLGSLTLHNITLQERVIERAFAR